MVPLVRLVMLLLWPIAYPIARVLDVVLHDEDEGEENMNRGELSALVRVQYEERLAHKRARKLEKVKFQQRKSSVNTSTMSTIPGGASTTATLTGRATPTDVVISKVSNAVLGSGGGEIRVGSLNFPHPKHRSAEADAAIKASRHEAFRSQHSGATTHSAINEFDNSRRSEGSGTGFGELKRSNSIHIDEVALVEGALQMKLKTAFDVLTPLHRIYAVPHDLILDEDNIVDIYSSGYSRIPVYVRDPDKPKSQAHIIGLLMTKHLIVVNPSDCRPLSTLPLQTPPCVSPKMNLVDLVNLFQTGQVGHLALVCARPKIGEDVLGAGHPLPESAGLVGIITLEDVFEALLQEQIYDEMDQMEREAEKIARWVTHKWRHYKAVKDEEDNNRLATMGDVVDDAMRNAAGLKGGDYSNSMSGEATFLLGKQKQDNDASSGGSGILSFFQSLGNMKNDNGD
jgi:Mg2+/Co2+ transporter CorC